MPEITWRCSSYDALSIGELYAMLKLRQEVFVVEQTCPYLDADGLDQQAFHLGGWQDIAQASVIVAYARLLPPGVKFEEISIGRVLTAQSVRRHGIGRKLIEEMLEQSQQLFPDHAIRISAQVYLENFYQEFGFRTVSQPYDEDGIAHIEMLRTPPNP